MRKWIFENLEGWSQRYVPVSSLNIAVSTNSTQGFPTGRLRNLTPKYFVSFEKNLEDYQRLIHLSIIPMLFKEIIFLCLFLNEKKRELNHLNETVVDSRSLLSIFVQKTRIHSRLRISGASNTQLSRIYFRARQDSDTSPAYDSEAKKKSGQRERGWWKRQMTRENCCTHHFLPRSWDYDDPTGCPISPQHYGYGILLFQDSNVYSKVTFKWKDLSFIRLFS